MRISVFLSLGVVLLGLARPVEACRPSTSWHPLRFSSVEQATLAASEFATESHRRDVEFGGAIVPIADHYRLTVNRGCAGADTIQFEVPSSSIALWHTHGRETERARQYFSEADAQVVRQTRLPFYLLDRDRVQVLAPDDIRAPLRLRTARATVRVHAYRGAEFALTRLSETTLPVRVPWFAPYPA